LKFEKLGFRETQKLWRDLSVVPQFAWQNECFLMKQNRDAILYCRDAISG